MRASTAADIALVLFAIFGVLGFGWRSWIQRRRTGSSGFRGISGRVGSLEWIAGLGFILALAVAVSAPILEWTKVVAPVPVLNKVWIQAVGMIIAAASAPTLRKKNILDISAPRLFLDVSKVHGAVIVPFRQDSFYGEVSIKRS